LSSSLDQNKQKTYKISSKERERATILMLCSFYLVSPKVCNTFLSQILSQLLSVSKFEIQTNVFFFDESNKSEYKSRSKRHSMWKSIKIWQSYGSWKSS